MLAEISPGSGGSLPTSFAALGSGVYFVASDAQAGREPWYSDGTAAGTARLGDLLGGPGDASPLNLFGVGSTLYLQMTELTSGAELWRSDGTAAGTALVKDAYPGTGAGAPQNFLAVNGVLYYAANDPAHGAELWRSDGTAAGTWMVKDIYPGASGSQPASLTNVNGTIYFSAEHPATGRELWKSDGTAAGTVLAANIGPDGPTPTSSSPEQLLAANGSLFFVARQGAQQDLYRFDGTFSWPVTAGGAGPSQPTFMNNAVYFTATDGFYGVELWRGGEGYNSGAMVADIAPGGLGSYPGGLTVMNGALYFSASDYVNGWELWKSDGTYAGTQMVTDLEPGGNSFPQNLRVMNGALYFTATTTASGDELWKSDGTAAGTTLVKDIRPGAEGASPRQLVVAGDTLFFVADDGTNGAELWQSDGTAAGTRLVHDINPGAAPGAPGALTQAGDLLYFAARDATHDALWALPLAAAPCAGKPAGHVCRAAAGACDVAETCDGTNAACPADGKAAAEAVCRAAAGACDVAETCDGTNAACPADGKAAAGAVCRAAAGACDVAETCDGASAACPADGKAAAGAVCRAAAGVCDVAETCDGASAACPADGRRPLGAACRAAAGPCDVAEACDGFTAACPTDQLAPMLTVCAAPAGACDSASLCDGLQPGCPPHSFLPAGTECRAAAGVCDVAEICTGGSPACPADAFRAAGTECRASAGPCDMAEQCTGGAAACPDDARRPAGAVCAAGSCSGGTETPAATCDGDGVSCAPATPRSCSPYQCGADACLQSCGADGECQSGYVCDSARCLPPPSASAGADQVVNEGVLVTLDGRGSQSPSGRPLSYTWSQTAGPAVTLSAPSSAQPTFTAPSVGAGGALLTFQLVVHDGQHGSQPALVHVSVKNLNQVPVASAGPDRSVAGGGAVTLDGSGSHDPDVEPITFSWTQVEGPQVALSQPTTAQPVFTAPVVAADTALRFRLTISDGRDSASDEVVITVARGNQPPVAAAGADQTRAVGETVVLSGSGSSDPDGDPLSFSWRQTGGAAVALSGAGTATPTFVATAPGALTFELTVSDGRAQATDTVVIIIAVALCTTNFSGLPAGSCASTTTVRNLAELQAWAAGPRTTNLRVSRPKHGARYDLNGQPLSLQGPCEISIDRDATFVDTGDIEIVGARLLVRNDMSPAAGGSATLRLRAGVAVEVRAASTMAGMRVIVEAPEITYTGDVDAVAAQVALCGKDVKVKEASTLRAAEVFIQATEELSVAGDIVKAQRVKLQAATMTLAPDNRIGSNTEPVGNLVVQLGGRLEHHGDIRAATCDIQAGQLQLRKKHSFQVSGLCTLRGAVVAGSVPIQGTCLPGFTP